VFLADQSDSPTAQGRWGLNFLPKVALSNQDHTEIWHPVGRQPLKGIAMFKRTTLAHLSALAVVGCLLVHCLFASDATGDTKTGQVDPPADLVPGTKCVITARLECEIHEVDKDAVLVAVTAIREAEQGVPMLSKVPNSHRLFKNVGVARTETKVVLRIPKDQVKAVTPIRDAGSAP
jgi:hypothetical protein